MTHTASREAHELGFQVGNHLCEVFAKAVFTTHEGFAWEEADDINACFLVFQSCYSEACFLTGLVGCEHCLVFPPVCALGLDLGLGNDAAIFSNQGDDEILLQLAFALWGRDITHEHREVVFGTCRYCDAVPTFIIDGVVAQYGIMGIVLAQRVDGNDNHWLRTTPGGGGIPSTMILRNIFKVAILNQFGIESSVSSIADILEEDADKLVADGLLLARDFQGGGNGLGDVDGVILLVVVHALLANLPVFCQMVEIAGDGLQFGWGDVEETAILLFAIDGNRVACPCCIANLAGFILAELPEVGRG